MAVAKSVCLTSGYVGVRVQRKLAVAMETSDSGGDSATSTIMMVLKVAPSSRVGMSCGAPRISA